MGFPSPIGTAEAFAAGRGKPQGCGLRVRKAGCRISPDPKPDAISRGHREAAVTSGGAGVARGAAASPPGTFAKDHAAWGNPLLANGTIPQNPPGHAARQTKPFHQIRISSSHPAKSTLFQSNTITVMCFPSPIGTAEAFAAGRGKPQGCGLRVRKAGCRISPDPKPDAISRGHREAAVTSGGAGVARGAAASPPGTFAYDYVAWGNPLIANETIPLSPRAGYQHECLYPIPLHPRFPRERKPKHIDI